jgi:tyrosinase
MIHYRRNINCLSTEALHDLREALAAIYALPASHKHSWMTIAGLHGSPSPAWCVHGVPGFLTWHRAYLTALDEALCCQRPNVTVPYWNWSSGATTGVPAACASPTYVNRSGDTVANPLYAGPLPPGAGAALTSRRADIATTSFGDLAATAQTAIANTDFDDFQSALNSVHGSVHGRVGGNMGSVPYAGYDPIFWLHHANVDRLWANWQAAHPVALPAVEANLELDPFNRPFSTDWMTGADVFSTDALGYRYANFCILVLPFPLREFIEIRMLPPWVRERLASAKLVLQSARMPDQSAEVRVFVNEPRPAEAPATTANPRFAGSIGIFGMRAHAPSAEDAAAKKRALHAAVAAVVQTSAAPASVLHGGAGPDVAHAAPDVAHAAPDVAHAAHDHAGHDHGNGHGGHDGQGGHGDGDCDCPDDPALQHRHRPGERFDLQLDITRAARVALEKDGALALSLVAVDVHGTPIADLAALPFDGAELRIE